MSDTSPHAGDRNPLHEVGVLRTRTEALAGEVEALGREALRLAEICDRQAAELQRLRASAPIEAEFHHCACCPVGGGR